MQREVTSIFGEKKVAAGAGLLMAAISSGLKPSLYYPAIGMTVTPVPATGGRPPRTSGKLTIMVPMSVTAAMTYLANNLR